MAGPVDRGPAGRRVPQRGALGTYSVQGLSLDRALGSEQVAGAVAMMCFFGTVATDMAWYGVSWGDVFLSDLTPSWLFWCAVVVNAVLLDQLLSARTPTAYRVTPWLRVGRPLFVAVPVVGLAGLPLWSWVVERCPAWAFRPRAVALVHLTHRSASWPRRLVRRLRSGIHRLSLVRLVVLLWFFVGQVLPFFYALEFISRATFHPPTRGGALTAGLVLHLVAALAGWAHVEPQLVQRRLTGAAAARHRLLPLGLLLPTPLNMVLIALWVRQEREKQEEQTLMSAVLDRHARRRVHRASGDGAAPGRLALVRWKCLCLLGDAALIWWFVGTFAASRPDLALLRERVLGAALCLAGGLSALAFVVWLGAFAHDLRRKVSALRPSLVRQLNHALMLSQGAVVFGVALSELAQLPSGTKAFWLALLLVSSVVGMGLVLAKALAQYLPTTTRLTPWAVLCYAVAVLAGGLAYAGFPRPVREVTVLLLILAALGHALTAYLFAHRLVGLSTRRELWRRPTRWLALTAWAPGGGLLAPLWVWAASRGPRVGPGAS